MSPTIRLLAERGECRLYSVYESVFLCDLRGVPDPRRDTHLADVYGDPDSGLISACGRYAAIAGCGMTISFLADAQSWTLGTEPGAILWTEGVHQSSDDPPAFVRFVARTPDDRLRVHRLQVFEQRLEVLDR
jgi:hypothetical protein